MVRTRTRAGVASGASPAMRVTASVMRPPRFGLPSTRVTQPATSTLPSRFSSTGARVASVRALASAKPPAAASPPSARAAAIPPRGSAAHNAAAATGTASATPMVGSTGSQK